MLELYTPAQRKIMKAAMELVARKGYVSLKMKHLAEALNITEGAIYKHFKGKFSIKIAIIDYVRENIWTEIAVIIKENTTSLDKLKKIFIERFKRISKNPEQIFFMNSHNIFMEDKEIYDKIIEIVDIYMFSIISIIETGQKNKEIINGIKPEHLFFQIVGGLNLFMDKWNKDGRIYDLMKEGEDYWNSVELLIRYKP
jgi:AcrR family transcriptional regulator